MKKLFAYSVKANRRLSQRKIDLLRIEAAYWLEQGVPFRLFFRDEANATLIENVRWIESFRPNSPLIPFRDRARQIESVVYPLVLQGIPLVEACRRTDAALALPRGTTLTQIRMFLHARVWTVDLTCKISPSSGLQILTRNPSIL